MYGHFDYEYLVCIDGMENAPGFAIHAIRQQTLSGMPGRELRDRKRKGRQHMNFFKWLIRGNSVRDVVLSLYKRGLASAMNHDQKGATDAYSAAIDMRDAPTDLRAMALYNRALLYAAAKEIPKAIQDLNAVLAMTVPLHKIKLAARQKLDRMQRRACMDTAPRLHARASSRQVASTT